MSVDNKAIVQRFENEFKNKANVAIVNELMAADFVHHAPMPVAGGREGLMQLGQMVFSLIDGIQVRVVQVFGEGDLVCTRVEAGGTLKASGEPIGWTENHIYRLRDGKIVEWWGEGAPPLG